MARLPTYRIAVLAGDGIGPEITKPCLAILERAAARVGGFALDFEALPAGAGCYRDTGAALPDDTVKRAKAADSILLACMGDPTVRYPDGTEIVPQIELRGLLDLYAGIRPVRPVPGVPLPLADERADDIDFVILRESTEGLFASRGKGVVQHDLVATETMLITRKVSEQLFRFAFGLARIRQQTGHPGRVTCVDKANVFNAFAFFRRVFDEEAGRNPDLTADHAYVDAVAHDLVRRPWDFDVLVTENMFGDILSDLGAALMGGMGMAPSADIGESYAVFQPCHGTAPDIAGKGRANPTAMILSAAMMLEWLGETQNDGDTGVAAGLIRDAVDKAFADSALVTFEHGGEAGTETVGSAVLAALDELPLAAGVG